MEQVSLCASSLYASSHQTTHDTINFYISKQIILIGVYAPLTYHHKTRLHLDWFTEWAHLNRESSKTKTKTVFPGSIRWIINWFRFAFQMHVIMKYTKSKKKKQKKISGKDQREQRFVEIGHPSSYNLWIYSVLKCIQYLCIRIFFHSKIKCLKAHRYQSQSFYLQFTSIIIMYSTIVP